MYKNFIRPILFLFDPERVHNFVMRFFSLTGFLQPVFKLLYNPKKNSNGIIVSGLTFRNHLGLAAGFDKDGKAINFWDVLGFSHIEVGTVTPLPQPGNEKPRIFRLVKDKAIINRLGFNNNGVDALKSNIIKARKITSKDFIIGVNIGKNKNTPIEAAYEDYKTCVEKLYDQADYFTINISSPNTEELRKLQGVDYLDKLLAEIQRTNSEISQKKSCKKKIIFIKIAPDLAEEEIIDIYLLSVKHNINGILATNTTITREGLSIKVEEEGGLSGKPLKELSDRALKKLSEENKKNESNKIALIGTGGVFDKKDFEDKLKNGAELIQIYTGFIYEGPGIIRKLLN